ncbi:unnamed protein product [Triticum turgidum subsp. durum]|uniref:Uncharacterized protein n=1 Tax=Triticum turgidum subsp. durum TaxID=4567 RepID=A0A9R1NHG0_TRITD|nr:unnamed protein product [Triticum turgidum subsp. durum]
MALVVGASAATMKSVMGKLGSLLAQEYTLIRGVNGDLQYINDELATMQSFLRDLGGILDGDRAKGHAHRMNDWMKQIRESPTTSRIASTTPATASTACAPTCAATSSPTASTRSSPGGPAATSPPRSLFSRCGRSRSASAGRADNQDASLQLVAMKDPVGVDEHMKELEEWLTNEKNSSGVLYVVGFGGVGKTTIATALYQKFGDRFDHRAMVTVSQSSDINAVLTNNKNQVMPQSSDQAQQGGEGVLGRLKRGTSAFAAKCCSAGTSKETRGETKLDQIKEDLKKHFDNNRYLVHNYTLNS